MPARQPWTSRLYSGLYRRYLNTIWGMDIGPGCTLARTARLDRSNPRGVHIGPGTHIDFGATVLSHNFVQRVHVDTHIGARCHIGPYAIIMPGVTIGDDAIVGAGSVVMRDVPARSAVVGNPARVIKNPELGQD